MPIEITFLGTGCMVPTKDRNVQAIFLEYNGCGLLLDCGEGTQRQMTIAGISRAKVSRILVSHWHGDHVAGLVGLIQTIGNAADAPAITLYGPVGSQACVDAALRSCLFENKVDLKVVELHPDGLTTFYENEDFKLQCIALEHTVPCLGYAFVEQDRIKIDMDKVQKLGLKPGPLLGKLQAGKSVAVKGKTIAPEDVGHVKRGKKVAFVFDTRVCRNAVTLVKDADLMVSESVFTTDLEEKARQFRHLTTKFAADIATQGSVKQLIITHFSQRYATDAPLRDEIQTFFPNARCAFDFMKVKV